jgi:hypothetical protein
MDAPELSLLATLKNPHITEPMHERAAASATYKRPLSTQK